MTLVILWILGTVTVLSSSGTVGAASVTRSPPSLTSLTSVMTSGHSVCV